MAILKKFTTSHHKAINLGSLKALLFCTASTAAELRLHLCKTELGTVKWSSPLRH